MSQPSQTSLAPGAERTTAPLHSQKESSAGIDYPARLTILCNRLPVSRTARGVNLPEIAALRSPQVGGSPKQPLIHQHNALPISAVFRLRYVHSFVRKWADIGDG